jgi:hypothetical protein
MASTLTALTAALEAHNLLVASELLGGGAACFYAFRAVRRATDRPNAFFLFCGAIACIVMAVACAVQSTLPSSAARRQVTGRLLSVVEHGTGRHHDYTFTIHLDTGGDMGFRAAVTAPFFARGELVTVTYLDENKKGEYPRAIGYQALTGNRAGEHDSVSADWIGPWIGVPLWFMATIALQALGRVGKRPKS